MIRTFRHKKPRLDKNDDFDYSTAFRRGRPSRAQFVRTVQ